MYAFRTNPAEDPSLTEFRKHVRPPSAPPLRLALLASLLSLGLPALAAVGALVISRRLTPTTLPARSLVTAALGILAAVGVAIVVQDLWRSLQLPGRGPADFLPARWVGSAWASRQAARAFTKLRLVPPAPSEDAKEALRSLSHSLAKRDIFTRAHAGRVSRLAYRVAEARGMSSEECETARLAALYHDIGKLAIPNAILFKPAPLDVLEFEVMQTHSAIGAGLVAPFVAAEVFEGVLHHHERVDGLGYPDRLKVDVLSLTPRIVMVCDSYDALTSDRPYRAGLSKAEAFEELRVSSGTHLDGELVETLIAVEESSPSLRNAGLLAPISLLLRRTKHLIHTSAAPAASISAAVAITGALSLGPTAVGPGRPEVSLLPPVAMAPAVPVAVGLPEETPQATGAEGGSVDSSPTTIPITQSQPPTPPEQNSEAPPPPSPPSSPPCQLPTGQEIPVLPVIGCPTDLLPS